MEKRVRVDCRKHPSAQGCTIAISGTPDEVAELGWLQAKLQHAHKDDEEKGHQRLDSLERRAGARLNSNLPPPSPASVGKTG